METIFTEGQIKKIMCPKALHWNSEDISSAICFHAAGPRAYNHLYEKGFRLPSLSTLQRWCSKIEIKEGLIQVSLDFMGNATNMSEQEKICILVFDEMKILETHEYDNSGDFVRKPTNFVHVLMARGLWKSWKHPIFFDFDCPMNTEILVSIVNKLGAAGYVVVGIVCDMGPSNRTLWKQLGVTVGMFFATIRTQTCKRGLILKHQTPFLSLFQ